MRRRLEVVAGPRLAGLLPSGYQRLGRVLVLRLPEELRPFFVQIGRWWQEALRVETVLRWCGPVASVHRTPRVEFLVGENAETEVREHGIRYRLDASRLLFARGNREERFRLGQSVRPGEVVVDLFAGIGYFTLPAAMHGAERVYACEVNPEAFRYLAVNLDINGVRDRVVPLLGDNRTARLPQGSADRVVLGLLPSSLPWVPMARACLRPSGGWMHVHFVADVRTPREVTMRALEEVVHPGVIEKAHLRTVKAYGPGRSHLVADLQVRSRT